MKKWPISQNDKDSLQECYLMVLRFFHNDKLRAEKWFHNDNGMLNNKTPFSLFEQGHVEKLKRFIEICTNG